MHLSDKKVATWLSQMGETMASGISPAEAAGLVGGLPERTQSALVEHFESGLSWGKAVESVLLFLTDTERSVLVAAEASGTLPTSIERLSEQRKQRAAFKVKMVLAMLYPFFIIHFAILIVPIQHIIDGDYGAYAKVLGMIYLPLWSFGGLMIIWSRIFPTQSRSLLRRVPLFGKYSLHRDMASLSETLAACGLAGLNLEYSWAMAASSVGSQRFLKLGESVLILIAQGKPVSDAFSEYRWLPQYFVQQHKVGERTGQLVDNLETVSYTHLTLPTNREV